PLGWLARRKGRNGRPLIDPLSFQAGERFRLDLTLAQMLPRVTANWTSTIASGPRSNTPMHYSDLIIASRQRVNHALDAVGPELGGVLMDVCGFLKGLELVEAERTWPARSAKIVLVIALAKLRRHYGLESSARGPAHSQGI